MLTVTLNEKRLHSHYNGICVKQDAWFKATAFMCPYCSVSQLWLATCVGETLLYLMAQLNVLSISMVTFYMAFDSVIRGTKP